MTDRWTNTQMEVERDKSRKNESSDRWTDRQKQREIVVQTYGQRDKQTNGGQTVGKISRQTNVQTNTQTEGTTDTWTDRQTKNR